MQLGINMYNNQFKALPTPTAVDELDLEESNLPQIAADIFKSKYTLLPTEQSDGFKIGYPNGFFDGYHHCVQTKQSKVVDVIKGEINIIKARLLIIKQIMETNPRRWTDKNLFNESIELRGKEAVLTDLLTKLNK